MESKRRAFPRFYFVSTADLLNILSNGNDPSHIMQHMSKFMVGASVGWAAVELFPLAPKKQASWQVAAAAFCF